MKLMAYSLAHSCPLARCFGGLKEMSDIKEGQRRLIKGKGVSWLLKESMEVKWREKRSRRDVKKTIGGGDVKKTIRRDEKKKRGGGIERIVGKDV